MRFFLEVCLALAVAAAGCFLLTEVPADWRRASEVWEKVEGRILAVHLEEREFSRTRSPFEIELDYEFVGNNERQRRFRVSAPAQPALNDLTLEEAMKMAARYQTGAAIEVYRNPRNERESRLTPRAPAMGFWLPATAGAAMLISGCWLAGWNLLRKLRGY